MFSHELEDLGFCFNTGILAFYHTKEVKDKLARQSFDSVCEVGYQTQNITMF